MMLGHLHVLSDQYLQRTEKQACVWVLHALQPYCRSVKPQSCSICNNGSVTAQHACAADSHLVIACITGLGNRRLLTLEIKISYQAAAEKAMLRLPKCLAAKLEPG